MALIRDSSLGQLIRYATKNKVLLYAEEKPDFKPPTRTYGQLKAAEAEKSARPTRRPSQYSHRSQQDVEDGSDKANRRKTIPPETILVDWYGPTDRENPHNWHSGKKVYVCFVVSFLTTGVYMSAAIISPGINNLAQEFGISAVAATLTLALYVLAYGIGPLLWSPLSELPIYGRNLFYVAPMCIYVCVQVACCLTPTFGGLLAARFITGFCGSAPLATGGASMTDIFSQEAIPYAFAAWTYGAVAGPSIGPVIAAYAIKHFNTWRWSMWISLMLTGLVTVMIFVSLPETSAGNILLRRARRLRKLTGNPAYRAFSEIEEEGSTTKDRLLEALIKPTEIAIKDPAMTYAHIYLSILYASYYLFFDAVPVVFEQKHRINVYNSSIVYLAIGVGIGLSLIIYLCLYRFVVVPKMKRDGPGEIEGILAPALVWTWFVPVGLFIFAWTSQASTSIWGPIIGLATYSFGVVIVFQCLFAYISTIYVRYAASVLAENDFLRSTLAAGLLIAGIPMFNNMGTEAGVSMLAGIMIVMSILLYGLFFFGGRLRARSKFAVK